MKGGLRTFVPWLGRGGRHYHSPTPWHPPTPWLRLRRFLGMLQERMPAGVLALQLLLTGLAIGHLALVFLFPAGRNGFLDIDLRSALPHLTLWRPSDAFGFGAEDGPRGFIRYAVFAQNGQVQEGVFPNPQVRPNLRYSRWAAAGDAISGNQPVLHAALLHYLLSNIGSSPIRVDLFAGEWEPDGPGAPAGDGRVTPARLSERARVWKLGTHDGLTESWKPATRNSNK